jgi:hypothetical protein
MPKPKKDKNEPEQPHTMLLRLDRATWAALAAYLASHDVPPKRNPVVVSALRRFLADRGFWPPKS